MAKKSVEDVQVQGKRVFVRADLNVTFKPKTTEIADDSRIRATLPTISYLKERGAKIILCSHLGRPGGKVQEEARLTPIARRLSELLSVKVPLAPDCIGPEVERLVQAMRPGDILLLENVRFHPEEEKNDPAFAKELASLADIYVNDAFGTAHRAHASTEGIAHHVPAVAGLLMKKEIESLTAAVASPKRPFAALLGGAKVTDKIAMLENLLPMVDRLLIGGGMAAAFLKAYGHEVGTSLLENGDEQKARDVVKAAARRGKVEVLLPLDVVVTDKIDKDARGEVVFSDKIPADKMMVDIGPRTVDMFRKAVRDAKTVVWNGPMGVFEYEPFAQGTYGMAKALAEATDAGAFTVTGGGSTAEAIDKLGLADRIRLVSTGGGATLEFLEGKVLPGIAALMEK